MYKRQIQNSEANKDLNVTGASFNLHKDSTVYAMGELADTMFSDAAVTEIEEDAEGYSDGYRYLWSWQFGLTPIAEGVTIERATKMCIRDRKKQYALIAAKRMVC